MGVPITFLDKYNPEQFEILGDQQSDVQPSPCGTLRRPRRLRSTAARCTGGTGSAMCRSVVYGKHRRPVRADHHPTGPEGTHVKIELKEITVREVANGYLDSAEEGVVGYGGRSTSGPSTSASSCTTRRSGMPSSTPSARASR